MEGHKRAKEVTIDRQVRGSFLMTVLLPDYTKIPASTLYIHFLEIPSENSLRKSYIPRVFASILPGTSTAERRASDILLLVAPPSMATFHWRRCTWRHMNPRACRLLDSAKESRRRVRPPRPITSVGIRLLPALRKSMVYSRL